MTTTFGNIFDLDNYTDAVSNAVDAIGDAGHEIGAVLKTIAPVISFIPGIGTAVSVAVYAAGAVAGKDKITDAIIGTASSAMPPGIPRIAFNGASDITRDIANGKNVWESAVQSCRQAAQTAGGEKAVAAFDAGLAITKGGKIPTVAIDQGRTYALTGGGQSAAAAFDAGVAIAKGEGADQVLLDVSRNYLRDTGGPLAAAAFDTGIAMGYGKTLQEAGWVGLHTFAKGNTGEEMIINFVESAGHAKNLKMGFQDFLEMQLSKDLINATMTHAGTIPSPAKILGPYLDTIKLDKSVLDWPAGKLAQEWGLSEIEATAIRTSQVLMRDGHLDERLLAKLEYNVKNTNVISSLQKTTAATKTITLAGSHALISAFDTPNMGPINSSRQKQGAAIIASSPELQHIRNSTVFLPQFPIDDLWRRGFDIGVAVTGNASSITHDQDVARDALIGVSQYNGFMAARVTLYKINRTKELIRSVQQSAIFSAAHQASKTVAVDSKPIIIVKPSPIGFFHRILISLGLRKE